MIENINISEKYKWTHYYTKIFLGKTGIFWGAINTAIFWNIDLFSIVYPMVTCVTFMTHMVGVYHLFLSVEMNPSKLEGVQKIHSIWRIYLKDMQTRLELGTKESIVINGRQVRIYDRNPNATFGGVSEHRQSNSDKLTIKNLPLSVSNNEIEKLLLDKNIKLMSSVKYGYIRDDNGQLTSYKSGDRSVYVEPYDTPLPKQQDIGQFKCLLIHHGKDIKCKACDVLGHRIGADVCKAKPTDSIYAFKGYHHPLSNHFPCQLAIYGKTFKSAEHAFFWRMASEMGNFDLAKEIQDAVHAGEAKRLSKRIAEDQVRWEWEDNNQQVMRQILEAKLQQCEQFKKCLRENNDKILAEATPSLKWATGMSPWATEHTSPEYWPGRNLLGAMLQDLSHKLSEENTEIGNEQSKDSSVPSVPTNPVSDDDDNDDDDYISIDSSASIHDASPDTMDELNMESDDTLIVSEDLPEGNSTPHDNHEDLVSQNLNDTSSGGRGQTLNQADQNLQPSIGHDKDQQATRRSNKSGSTSKSKGRLSTHRSASTSSVRNKKVDMSTQKIRDAFEKGKRKKPSSSPDHKDSKEKLHKANLETDK